MTEPLFETMTQLAPYPHALAVLVEACTYRPGWTLKLRHLVRDHVDPEDDTSAALPEGLTLIVTTRGYDSYHPDRGEFYGVRHYRPVPPATYVEADWQRWLFKQLIEIERHEAMEFFTVNGGRPYAPLHGPGRDPYIVHDPSDVDERRVSFRGRVNPADGE